MVDFFFEQQKEQDMDAFITNLVSEYHEAFLKTLEIGTIIAVWVVFAGFIRFGIAVYRRKKGIYPPAESMRESH